MRDPQELHLSFNSNKHRAKAAGERECTGWTSTGLLLMVSPRHKRLEDSEPQGEESMAHGTGMILLGFVRKPSCSPGRAGVCCPRLLLIQNSGCGSNIKSLVYHLTFKGM